MSAYTVLESGEPARYYERNCDLYGHVFAITTETNGDTLWTCTHCGYTALECPHDPAHTEEARVR